MIEDENEDEITSVHGGEPLLPPAAVGPVRPRPLVSDQLGWSTVVLPGGGHPDHVVDRTQLLALDEPDAAISATARLSLGAPEPVEAVDSGGLTSIRPPAGLEPFPALPATVRGPSPEAGTITSARSTAPPTDGPGTVPVVISSDGPGTVPVVISSDGPGTVPVAVAERRTTAPPTRGPAAAPGPHPDVISGGPTVVGAAPNAGHPVVPGPGSHPAVISGASPIVGVPPSGAHPMVISGGHPAVGAAPTGGHPVLSRPALRGRGRAPTSTADTRLAWGFLLGVLITVAIVSVAVALGLYLVR